MKATVHDITYIERKMTIDYWVGYEIRTFAGWISLMSDGHTVVARKFGGRNRWSLASLVDIESVHLD